MKAILKRQLSALNHRRLAKRAKRKALAQGFPNLHKIVFICYTSQDKAASTDWMRAFGRFGIACSTVDFEAASASRRSETKHKDVLTIHMSKQPSAVSCSISAQAFISPPALFDEPTHEISSGAQTTTSKWLFARDQDQLRRLLDLGHRVGQVYLMPTSQSAESQPGHELFKDVDTALAFYAGRFLLAQMAIDFSRFMNVMADLMAPIPDMVCLGVIEYPDRYDAFQKEDAAHIKYFPGLRHNIGWIGCGISYKFLLSLARRHKKSWILICEDDVALPKDWATSISSYTSENTPTAFEEEIDLFSGIVTDIPTDTKILHHKKTEKEQIAVINRTTGTVFNIYANRIFDHICDWNENDTCLKNNAIDRHIDKKENLRVATQIPFLVGHKEGLNSTLWPASNKIYINQFKSSQEKIAKAIENQK